MGNQDLGIVEHWLRNIRDVRRIYNDELMAYVVFSVWLAVSIVPSVLIVRLITSPSPAPARH